MDVRAQSPDETLAARVERTYPTVALVLQGGGALGAYQAGVLEALAESGIAPHWIAGISIRALNAAIIAGNPPEERVAKLRTFWGTICQPPFLSAPLAAAPLDGFSWPLAVQERVERHGGAAHAVRGPGRILPAAAARAAVRAMAPRSGHGELVRHRAAARHAGAAGGFRSPQRCARDACVGGRGERAHRQLRLLRQHPADAARRHFMASGALPPGFPAVEIDGEYYWDGGMVSNTPLYRSCWWIGPATTR